MTQLKFEKQKYLSMKLKIAFNLKSQKKYKDAQKILYELNDEYQNNVLIKKSIADLMLKQNRLTNATAICDEILNSTPNDSYTMTIKGQIFYKQKNYEGAKEWFKSAIKHKSSNFSLQMLIKTMIKLGEIEEASSLIDCALIQQKDNPYLLQSKAEILHNKGMINEAIEIYEQILKNKPHDKYIYKELIKLKTENMDENKAMREIETLLKISSYSKNEHLYTQQAENFKKLKDYEKAIDCYKKGLNLSPNNLFIQKQIGYCLNKLHRYDDVIDAMKDPFLKEPTDYLLRNTLFAAYKKKNREEEIKELIEELGISGTSLYWSLMNEAKK